MVRSRPKKDKTMYRVSAFDFCKSLESRVKEKKTMSAFDFCKSLESRVKEKKTMCCLAEWGIFRNLWHWKQDIIPNVIKNLKKSVPTSSASNPHNSTFDDLISKIKLELEDGDMKYESSSSDVSIIS